MAAMLTETEQWELSYILGTAWLLRTPGWVGLV